MKKKLCCFVAALCLLLCACGQRPDDAQQAVKVDLENGTVVDGAHVALLTAAAEPAGTSTKLEKIAFGLVALAIGVFIVVKPRDAWHLSHGRKYRHVEPSKRALVMEYITGVVVIIIGMGFLLL